jgi:Icc protein
MLIAQITDTHIKAPGSLSYGKVDTCLYLQQCIAHINKLSPRPDVVLVTGDITDFGRPEEYTQAGLLLNQLIMPYFVIPGNHDQPDAMRVEFSDHCYLPAHGFIQYVIEDFPIRMIGLDTQVIGKPYGLMCQERLNWLEQQLVDQTDKPTLLFMHHPPFKTGIKHMDVQNCRNSEALGDLVKRHRQIKFILCGHVHRQIEVAWHGTIAAIGPSPAHSVALDLNPNGPSAFRLEPRAIKLIHWNGANIIGHLSYIGEYEGPYPFFDKDDNLIE